MKYKKNSWEPFPNLDKPEPIYHIRMIEWLYGRMKNIHPFIFIQSFVRLIYHVNILPNITRTLLIRYYVFPKTLLGKKAKGKNK